MQIRVFFLGLMLSFNCFNMAHSNDHTRTRLIYLISAGLCIEEAFRTNSSDESKDKIRRAMACTAGVVVVLKVLSKIDFFSGDSDEAINALVGSALGAVVGIISGLSLSK